MFPRVGVQLSTNLVSPDTTQQHSETPSLGRTPGFPCEWNNFVSAGSGLLRKVRREERVRGSGEQAARAWGQKVLPHSQLPHSQLPFLVLALSWPSSALFV